MKGFRRIAKAVPTEAASYQHGEMRPDTRKEFVAFRVEVVEKPALQPE